MTHVTRRPAASAFTLVELLVVIGIIALLVSILLPTLNKARESSYRINCASNLRQQGVAIMMYATENQGQYPYSSSTAFTGGFRLVQEGSQLIAKYTRGNKLVWICPSFTRRGRPLAAETNLDDVLFYGGGYAHGFGRFSGGNMVIGDPWAAWQGFDENVFRLMVTRSNNTMVGGNKLTSVKKRAMIKWEQYTTKPSDILNYGGQRHLGKSSRANAQTAGGNVLFNDGSVTWSSRLAKWPSWFSTPDWWLVVPEEGT